MAICGTCVCERAFILLQTIPGKSQGFVKLRNWESEKEELIQLQKQDVAKAAEVWSGGSLLILAQCLAPKLWAQRDQQ